MTVTPMAISLINFPDKLTECLIPIQIQELTIPKQGEYVFSVTADGELITQRSIEFFVKGNSQLVQRITVMTLDPSQRRIAYVKQ